ncbi:MAG TPA: phosphoribosyltransferase family protein, partial [Bacteroidales bacterium]
MKKVKILDQEFKMVIPSDTIKLAIDQVATQINNDYFDDEILFLSILNGSFMFASDLVKRIKPLCQLSFVKLSSYNGDTSTGTFKELIGLNENIKGRKIIVIEDIVDTGATIETIIKQLKAMNPESVKVATLLFKPQSYIKNLKIDYVGLEIPGDFLIGY